MKTLALFLMVLVAAQIDSFAQAGAAAALAAPAAASPPASPVPQLSGPPVDEWKLRQEAAIHAKWNVCVDLQMVAVEEGKALDLIPDLQSGERGKFEAAWNRLQAMIKAKEAVLLGWPMVWGIDGSRSVSESILEKRYATGFVSPVPLKAGVGLPAAPAPSPDKDKPVVQDAIATEFETRNIGVTLEADVTVLDEGKRVHVNVVPQRVELLEMQKFVSTLADGKTVQETQPLFATSKTTQELTLQNGERALIGVHKLTKPEGYIEFHFVRAVATKAEP